jgi:protease-4
MRRLAPIFVLAAVAALCPHAKSDEATPVLPGVAHIRFSGSLDESPVPTDSLFGAQGENLRTRLDRIRKAKNDPKIKALYIEIDELSMGFGKLAEVRRAIADFRESGKKAFAYMEDGSAKDYLLAMSCDVVAMPESGTLMLNGMSAEVTFYKDLLEMAHVKVDVLKVGDYKGAVEPFTRSSLSKENREQIESMLDDNFEHEMVNAIVRARSSKKWTAEAVKRLIDKGPFTAPKALTLGLIDTTVYPDGLQELIRKSLDAPKIEVVRDYGREKSKDVDMSNPFALLKMFSPPKPKESKEPKIAVIYAIGSIATGRSGGNPLTGDSVGSTTLVEAIRHADADPTVKAIVLRVDSPGGSALASDLIWNALIACKKPVVASMSDVAASGGYYISMAASKIFAEPGTITGSIGVFGMKLIMGDLQERVGIKTETIRRGANAGIMTSNRPYTELERKTMTEIIEQVYEHFIAKTLAGRHKAGVKLEREQLLKLAGGRVWTGRQAKANGLVDELGTLDDAIAAAKKMANLDPAKEMELLVLPKPMSFIDKLIEGDLKSPLGQSAVETLGIVPGFEPNVRAAGFLLKLRNDPALMMLPYRIELK